MPGAYGGDNGEARTQHSRSIGIVERDLYGDSLHDFSEIAGGIVGGKQGKLRTAGWCDFQYLSLKHLSWIFVYADLRRVTESYVGELRLAIICQHPFNVADKRNYLGPWRNQLPWSNLPLADGPVFWRANLGVAEIHLGDSERGLFGVEVGDELRVLRFQDILGAPFSLGRQFVAAQQRLGLSQVGVTACELGGEALLVRDRLLDLL